MATRFPFSSFPNGWFAVAWSSEVAPGDVRPLKALGRDLVLYRSESGVAGVLDAFCPHLGTHLGHGGRVVAESIRCPFHGWRFDGCGDCVEVPEAKKIPPRAQIGAWLVRERNGVILVHHHHHGTAPTYEIPEAPELAGGAWTRPLRYGWKVRTHVQEVAENLADVRHFLHLHGQVKPRLVQSEFATDNLRIQLDAEGSRLDMRLHGLGVELSRIELGGTERFFAAKFMTPIDEDHVELRVLSCARIQDADVADAERKAVLFKDVTSNALLQDVPIWENKRYQPQPLLAAEDGPIAQFRRWARQFYPEATV